MYYEVLINGISFRFEDIDSAVAFAETSYAHAEATPALSINYCHIDDRDF